MLPIIMTCHSHCHLPAQSSFSHTPPTRNTTRSLAMPTFEEAIRRKQEELLATKKRKQEITQTIRSTDRELHATAGAVVPSFAWRQAVAVLLEQMGASSFESSPSPPSLSPELSSHTSCLLLLLELSGFCTDVVVSWAMGQGLPRKQATSTELLWDTDRRSNIAAGVEWLYILAPPHNDDLPEESLRLSRYVIEYRLFHWLVGQNCDSGVSPGNSQLIAEAVRCAPADLPLDLKEKVCMFFTNNNRTTRYWTRSFCDRWGIDIGRRLRAGENMPPEVMDLKESWLC
jgi:hypothetical protein